MPPPIDSLKFKLRAISILRNNPDRVYDLIDDLMNHYFITETRRPAYLLHVMVHAYEMAIQSMKHPQMGERDLKLLMAYDELLGLPAPVVGVMPPSAKPDEEAGTSRSTIHRLSPGRLPSSFGTSSPSETCSAPVASSTYRRKNGLDTYAISSGPSCTQHQRIPSECREPVVESTSPPRRRSTTR
jgi:hypothetical protein